MVTMLARAVPEFSIQRVDFTEGQFAQFDDGKVVGCNVIPRMLIGLHNAPFLRH